jgi:hypothetical protein
MQSDDGAHGIHRRPRNTEGGHPIFAGAGADDIAGSMSLIDAG